jgi:glycine/D-amino acid oxidase-like deaminating enzyme
VGARVAGSATTLLLARLGYDVAVADRDIPERHATVMRGAVARTRHA